MNYKRILGYLWVFFVATVISLVAITLFFVFVIGSFMFVIWAFPTHFPFTWVIFRMLFVLSMLIAICFTLSKEGKEMVYKTERKL